MARGLVLNQVTGDRYPAGRPSLSRGFSTSLTRLRLNANLPDCKESKGSISFVLSSYMGNTVAFQAIKGSSSLPPSAMRCWLELADTCVLETHALGRGGSTPSQRTKFIAAENGHSRKPHKLSSVGSSPTPATKFKRCSNNGSSVACQVTGEGSSFPHVAPVFKAGLVLVVARNSSKVEASVRIRQSAPSLSEGSCL